MPSDVVHHKLEIANKSERNRRLLDDENKAIEDCEKKI